MIQAGDLIDNTIGVKFGLATLAAAACGQIFSDVSGVAFGGVVEDACARLGLRAPQITAAQRALPRVRRAARRRSRGRESVPTSQRRRGATVARPRRRATKGPESPPPRRSRRWASRALSWAWSSGAAWA